MQRPPDGVGLQLGPTCRMRDGIIATGRRYDTRRPRRPPLF